MQMQAGRVRNEWRPIGELRRTSEKTIRLRIVH